ncbi:DUF6624 domain-containing protein [Algoriphagus sp.]|uniref:DUF6624 domain-containing protein n=1 Tax=Algoriphagus sp. TaxID=1872435 RepID=UPI0025D5A954|nr:DUF6624 domain-containing protein [Algoriphagus sp.]
MKIPNYLILFLIIVSFGTACQTKTEEKEALDFNQSLAEELKAMAEIDQIAANIPQEEHLKLTPIQWEAFQDSVFTTHQTRLAEIFEQYGFVGFDLAGEEGSFNFWLMVQHSDHDPDFQTKVLGKMKIEVDNNNAQPNNYGLLVDRVKLNTGEKQIYGTQVTYNLAIGQAYPKSLEDSVNVNRRRESIGLEPLELYLNSMTEMHFEMNKEYYLEKGITSPSLYQIKE